jgi:hypothetical protein
VAVAAVFNKGLLRKALITLAAIITLIFCLGGRDKTDEMLHKTKKDASSQFSAMTAPSKPTPPQAIVPEAEAATPTPVNTESAEVAQPNCSGSLAQANNYYGIKLFPFVEKLEGEDSGITPKDGKPNFAKFKSPELGHNVAMALLMSEKYQPLTLHDAIQTWNNHGTYGDETLANTGLNPQMHVGELVAPQLEAFLGTIQKAEGICGGEAQPASPASTSAPTELVATTLCPDGFGEIDYGDAKIDHFEYAPKPGCFSPKINLPENWKHWNFQLKDGSQGWLSVWVDGEARPRPLTRLPGNNQDCIYCYKGVNERRDRIEGTGTIVFYRIR